MRCGPESPVGIVMDNSFESIQVLLACFRSGRRTVSLPLPPRGSTVEHYEAFVATALANCDTQTLVLPDEFVGFLSPANVEVVGTSTLAVDGKFREEPERASLVQFTSGSTADPKGIALPLSSVADNIDAIHQAIALDEMDSLCSWVPLSHDMGLVGILLSGLVASGKIGGGRIVLLRPEDFVRRPHLWLDACSEFAATVTASPDFGFVHATRSKARLSGIDLAKLRVCITGAEPVRPSTLRSFWGEMAPMGLRRSALSPAYGMAECALAVSIKPPGKDWTSVTIDRSPSRKLPEPLMFSRSLSLGPSVRSTTIIESCLRLPQGPP